MKKAFFFAGLAAATLSLVGCNKEADLAVSGKKVEIVLSNVDTRTVNEGMSTAWVNDDALNVFVAPAGSTEYSSNNKFVVDDAASNHASGTVTLGSGAYDWYLLYPYDSHVTTPANTNAGYLTVGSGSKKTQTQVGINSKAHLAGANLPVYGIVKSVPAEQTPVVSMKHVAAVICVNVTNGTTAPIKVTSVSFTAPVDIIGTYYIDFTSNQPGFVGSGDNYVSKTASLTVTGDETIAAGASGKFYLAVKPFEAKSGESLSLKVTADGKEFEKTISAPANLEFKNGYIKTLNITYSGGAEIPSSTLAQIAAMDDDESVQTNEVLVVAKNARGIMLAENDHYLQAFDNAGVNGAVGDIVTVSGKVGSYAGLKQIVSPIVEVVSSNNNVILPDPKVLDGAGMDAYESTKIELIQYVGTLAVSGSYYNVEVQGASKKGSIQYPLNTEALTALKGKAVTATGFFTGISGSSTKYVNIMSTSVVEAAVNVFDVTPPQIELPATATSAVITVSGNVDWTAEASAGAAIDTDHGTGAGTITVTFPANTDTQVKEYTVFVRTTASGVNDEFEVNITQAAASNEPKFVKVTSASDLVDGKYLIVSEAGTAVLKDAADLGGGANVITVTIKSGEIDVTDELVAAQFTFDLTNGYIKGPNGKYIGNTSATSNGLKTSDTGYANTITILSNGDAEIISSQTYLRYNSSAGESNLRFRYYKAASYETQKPIQLYKLTGVTPPVQAALVSITVSGQKTEFNVNEAFTLGSGKVTATFDDGSTKDVTSFVTNSNPDMTTAGTKQVTLSYTENAVTKTASYEITVKAAVTPTHAGTAEDPYTVAEALAATLALGSGNTSEDYVYTKGIISSIQEVSTDHGNATYFISDDGTTSGQFEVFRGKYLGNMNFTAADQIQVGDEVVINGKLTYYATTSTPEIAQGNFITSLKHNGASVYAFNASAASTTIGASGGTVKVNVYGNVNWTASVTDGATLSANSGSGYGSFNVVIPANETAAEKTFTVSVATTASVSNSPISLTIKQDKQASGNQVVLDLSTKTYSSDSEDQVVWETAVMTVTVNKADATTAANNYLGGDANNRTSSRFYKGSKVTFTPKSGVTVTSMVFTATSNDYAKALANSTWTNASSALDETKVTVTPTNGANATEVSIGGVCGFKQITITYE